MVYRKSQSYGHPPARRLLCGRLVYGDLLHCGAFEDKDAGLADLGKV